MTMKKNIIGYFLSFIMANIILFLGVADDSKVVGQLKCNAWFRLHTSAMTVTLSGRSWSYDVKYFLRYICYIPIIRSDKYFKIFFLLISRLSYVHHCRLTSFGLLGVMVKNKKIKSVLRKLTMLLRKSDTAMHILLCLELPLNLLW